MADLHHEGRSNAGQFLPPTSPLLSPSDDLSLRESNDDISFYQTHNYLTRFRFRSESAIASHPRRSFYAFIIAGLFIVGLTALSLTLLIISVSEASNNNDKNNMNFIPGCPTNLNHPRASFNDTFFRKLHADLRNRLLGQSVFASLVSAGTPFMIFMQGGNLQQRYDTDVGQSFRQESNFLYLTGVENLPGCQLLIDCASNAHAGQETTCYSNLLIPKTPDNYAIWTGYPPSREDYKQQYGTDEVFYVADLPSLLWNITIQSGVTSPTDITIYTYDNQVSFPDMNNFTISASVLKTALRNSRVIKTDAEIELMRVAIEVSSQAHLLLMQVSPCPNLYEYNLASYFESFCSSCSLGHQAYLPIVGAGYHSAILHYVDNLSPLNWKFQPSIAWVPSSSSHFEKEGTNNIINYNYNDKGNFNGQLSQQVSHNSHTQLDDGVQDAADLQQWMFPPHRNVRTSQLWESQSQNGRNSKRDGESYGNFVLVDAGAEFHGYGADVTRTFPVNGRWSPQQRTVYTMVLNVQQAAIDAIKPGVTWGTIAQLVINRVLIELANNNFIFLTDATANSTIRNSLASAFLPHGFGHLLGLDVHDAWITLASNASLAPGMILTVEPGIYFNEVSVGNALNNPVLQPFINIPLVQSYLDSGFGGVRIEDDVLVNSTGYEILSTAAPRQITDIEATSAHYGQYCN
jgi:Xaa-Pro aminopeptidase